MRAHLLSVPNQKYVHIGPRHNECIVSMLENIIGVQEVSQSPKQQYISDSDRPHGAYQYRKHDVPERAAKYDGRV
jgi:hypothetical protein